MKTVNTFTDRKEAGQRLAAVAKVEPGSLVLAIPRGGVVVGYEVARSAGADLDIIMPRRLRAPEAPELSIGAVCWHGLPALNQRLIDALQVSPGYLRQEIATQEAECHHLERIYRQGREPAVLEGRHVVLVDDGIVTGHTMRAAIRRVLRDNPSRVTVAVPAAPARIIELLTPEVDEFLVLYGPDDFEEVAELYEQFGDTTDEEVIDLLERSALPAREH